MNDKGMSIVEIIISVTLISIVIILLFSVLITVRNEDERGKVTSNMLMNQAVITKEIEEDFINLGLIGIESCSDSASQPDRRDSVLKILPASSSLRNQDGYCMKFIYDPAKTVENIGYLLYYSYGFSATEKINVLGYSRGDTRLLRETPYLFDEQATYKNSCGGKVCALKIDMPVFNEDGEDFGIHLSYVYDTDLMFKVDNKLTNDIIYRFKVEK